MSAQTASRTRRRFLEPLATKVPEITALFWVIKLVTTFMGEATSDFLGDVSVALGAVVELLIIVLAVRWQFRTRRYYAPAYWFLAMSIAISGTGASDTLHVAFGLPYGATSGLWAVVLATIFWRWHRSEGTLSIHSITTLRREKFYWATVFATFALGTALGDFSATVLHIGYLGSALIYAGIILIPAVGWVRFKRNAVVSFWFAYVVTRPLGASFADYVGRGRKLSGINAGSGPTSLVSGIVLVLLVGYVTVQGRRGRSVLSPQTSQVRAGPSMAVDGPSTP